MACAYRTAHETANNRREFNSLTEKEAKDEESTRDAFCKAFAALLKKHPDVITPQVRKEAGL
jgi:hypothetical protein